MKNSNVEENAFKEETSSKDLPLDELGSSKNHGKRKKVFKRVIASFVGVLLTVALGFCAFSSYVNIRYDLIWINGASMFPTLNYGQELYDENGDILIKDPEDGWMADKLSNRVKKSRVDSCVVDSKSGLLERVERLDIIGTYYPSDYDSSGNLIKGSTPKCKRVIGLPNETIKFDASGDLYIVEEGTETKIPQDFLEYDSNRPELTVEWLEAMKANTGALEVTLGEGEYYVVGDNRMPGCSLDSRFFGPIKSDMIIAKVVAINGRIWFDNDENEARFPQFNWFWPWDLRYL